MEQIITSILDTDYYKLLMQQCVFHQYPKATVKYVFKCRNKDVKLGFLTDDIIEQINIMSSVSLNKDEYDYLAYSSGHLSFDYLRYLQNYTFNPKQVNVKNNNGELEIFIDGSWLETILWEVPLLSIINELYFEKTSDFKSIQGHGELLLRDKINLIKQYPRFKFSEFGTRRRYSKSWQNYITKTLHTYLPQLIGSSNVRLSMDLGTKPIGTVAHEYFSAHIALVDDIREAQRRALFVWLQEFNGKLGIALTDTFTTKAFFNDFDLPLANLYQGVRQDSGDPFEFGRDMIKHYSRLGIDSRTKSIVFSDGLDIPKAIDIYKEFTGLIDVSFGIGTSLTNSLGCHPLNIVIKLVECNNKPVVKLSDNITKYIGNEEVINKIKKAYNI